MLHLHLSVCGLSSDSLRRPRPARVVAAAAGAGRRKGQVRLWARAPGPCDLLRTRRTHVAAAGMQTRVVSSGRTVWLKPSPHASRSDHGSDSGSLESSPAAGAGGSADARLLIHTEARGGGGVEFADSTGGDGLSAPLLPSPETGGAQGWPAGLPQHTLVKAALMVGWDLGRALL